MFFATTTTSDLGAAIGSVSSPVVASLLPYVYVIGGLYVGFWLIKKIISLIPKSK